MCCDSARIRRTAPDPQHDEAIVESSIPLRIVVVNPPLGVEFRVQRGRGDLLLPSESNVTTLAFAFRVRVGAQADGRPNFLGEYAQGTPTDRFVYVNSGSRGARPAPAGTVGPRSSWAPSPERK